MNLKDEEWHPEPTNPGVLRNVKISVNACKDAEKLKLLRSSLLEKPLGGAIPHEVRGTIWLLLLGLRADELLAEDAGEFARAARSAVTEKNSRDQIEKDIARTRPGLKRFKNAAVRGALLRLLSLFCLRKQVQYIQGFNELLAPFILLTDTGSNPRLVYALFSTFLTKFAPWLLDTSESRVFGVLKRAFKYFGRLLLYQDPEVFWLLERNMMTPDLYATSWFVTLFARNFTVENVIALWDLVLLGNRPLGIVFFGLALVLSKRDELLSIDPSRLPETLMMLSVASPDEIRKLWKRAEEMRAKDTPESFHDLMEDRLLHPSAEASAKTLSAARSMQAAVCLQMTTSDLNTNHLKPFIWDCRTKGEYDAGHLAQAAYLPLDAVRSCYGESPKITEAAEEELEHAFELCRPLRGSSHICLVGSGFKEEDDSDVNALALYLTKHNVKFVSTLRGGFRAVVAAHAATPDSNGDEIIAKSATELVDYNQSRHVAARAARQHSKSLQDRRNRLAAKLDPAKPHDQSPALQRGSAISSFLEKTDAEMSRVLGRALSGLGATFASYTGKSDDSEQAPVSDSLQDSTSPVLSIVDWMSTSRSSEGSSPHHEVPSLNISGEQHIKSLGSGGSEKAGSISIGAPVDASSSRKWSKAGFRSSPFLLTPRPPQSPGGAELPPYSQRDRGPPRTGFLGSRRSPRGSDARPGWLNDESLEYSLESMPKGFIVNVMDEQVMKGLRLFPCRAKSGKYEMKGEFKRRYVGVSKNYYMLLGPQGNRSHLLEVKLIRRLSDVVRITFKRNRPELVTFELLDENNCNEFIACIMPDGLSECVNLIRGFLAEKEASKEIDSTSEPKQDVPAQTKAQLNAGQQSGGDLRNDQRSNLASTVQGDCSNPESSKRSDLGPLLDLSLEDQEKSNADFCDNYRK